MSECGKVKKVLGNKIAITIYSWTLCEGNTQEKDLNSVCSKSKLLHSYCAEVTAAIRLYSTVAIAQWILCALFDRAAVAAATYLHTRRRYVVARSATTQTRFCLIVGAH